jgi:uncharacterized protein YceK
MKKLFVSILLALTVTGCSTLVAPTTMEQRQAYVDAGITATAKTLRDRVSVGAVSKEDGKKIQQVLVQAAQANDKAKGLVSGEGIACKDELTCLQLAQKLLLEVEVELSKRNPK